MSKEIRRIGQRCDYTLFTFTLSGKIEKIKIGEERYEIYKVK